MRGVATHRVQVVGFGNFNETGKFSGGSRIIGWGLVAVIHVRLVNTVR